MLIFFIVDWNECNLLSSLDRSLGTMTARISTRLGCSFDKRENIKGSTSSPIFKTCLATGAFL